MRYHAARLRLLAIIQEHQLTLAQKKAAEDAFEFSFETAQDAYPELIPVFSENELQGIVEDVVDNDQPT